MAGALVFLVGQLFLFGTTSAQCPETCSPCKVFPDGNYTGTWNLKAEIDSRCIDSCLYQRESDGDEMCFCDPGPTDYNTTCLGYGCISGCDTTDTWLVVTGGDNNSTSTYDGRLKSSEIITSTGVCKTIPSPSIPPLPMATSAGEMAFMTRNWIKGPLVFCGGSTTFKPNTLRLRDYGATNVCYELPIGPPDAWSVFPGMLEERAWFSLTKIDQNTMIAVGGIDSSGTATDSMEQYSFLTGTWTLLSSLPEQRFGHCTVPSYRDGKSYLIVIGGSGLVGVDQSWDEVNTVYQVDVTDSPPTTTSLKPLPEKLFRPACTISCGGDIFVSGGASTSPRVHNKVYKYTFSTDTWSTVGSLLTERYAHVMGMVGASANRKMSVAGGFNLWNYLTSVEDSFDSGVTWSDRTTGLTVAREYAAAAEVPANTFRCQG